MFIVPYILILVAIELAAIIFLMVDRAKEKLPVKKNKNNKKTFKGFYVDR
jgi:hypothetical protein